MARQGGKSSGARNGGGGGKAARPAGRQSPAVYRRRRVVLATLLACLLVLLGVGAWGAVGLVRAAGHAAPSRTADDAGPVATPTASAPAPSAGASPTAAVTESATPSATPSAAPTPTCDPAKIAVAASTDKTVYAPTENPVLTLKVTNQNSIPCPVNVGTSQMEYLVASGADRIFDSKDCQDGSADLVKTLAPGASETANFPWPRVRSTEGCKAVTIKPRPGQYVLTTSLGSIQSKKAVFELQ